MAAGYNLSKNGMYRLFSMFLLTLAEVDPVAIASRVGLE